MANPHAIPIALPDADRSQLRGWVSPAAHLVFCGYDFAIPDGRGICC
jgi:hypothetical protein